jgi:hypothetical protein
VGGQSLLNFRQNFQISDKSPYLHSKRLFLALFQVKISENSSFSVKVGGGGGGGGQSPLNFRQIFQISDKSPYLHSKRLFLALFQVKISENSSSSFSLIGERILPNEVPTILMSLSEKTRKSDHIPY